MNKFEQACMRLMIRHPFFGSLIASTPVIADPSVPTACTDMRKVWYNPSFIDELPNVNQVAFVAAHEVMHIALLHGLRRGNRDPNIWNIAADYAINYILVAAGMEMPKGGLHDAKFKDMSAEQIYDLLLDDAKSMPQYAIGPDLLEPGSGSPGDSGKDGKDGDGHAKGMTDAQKADLEQEIQRRVAAAAITARQCGMLPGYLARAVDEVLNPKVRWQDLLREYLTRVTRNDDTWSRRNRRVSSVFLPGKHSHAMGEIVIIGDTSGSISNDDLNQVAAEVRAIADMLRPERIRLMWADAKVAGEQEFESGEELTFQPVGGGGTDMRVPLEKAAEYDPAVVVLMTDGYTPWPDAPPPYPLIVCCTTDVRVPVGDVVRV